LEIANISKENLEDVFKICASAFEIYPHNKIDCRLYKKGVEARRRWIIDMLGQHGPCAKIAYLDGSPVAQIVFCPEETIPFIRDPRKDVVSILCVYSPFPETQRKGVASALLKNLVDECKTGLRCMGGRPCHFAVTMPFSTMGRQSLIELHKKNGFRQGHKEMFLEIKGKYVPRDIPEYHPLPGDLDRTVILYTPACEWGYFYAFKIEEFIKKMDSGHSLEVYNIWERPEEYIKRSLQKVTAGRSIVKGHVTSGGIFWTDRESFLREVEEALRE